MCIQSLFFFPEPPSPRRHLLVGAVNLGHQSWASEWYNPALFVEGRPEGMGGSHYHRDNLGRTVTALSSCSCCHSAPCISATGNLHCEPPASLSSHSYRCRSCQGSLLSPWLLLDCHSPFPASDEVQNMFRRTWACPSCLAACLCHMCFLCHIHCLMVLPVLRFCLCNNVAHVIVLSVS